MQETVNGGTASYELTENGNLTSTLLDTGNTVTGTDSQTLAVVDNYTMTECGTQAGGAFSENVTGTETATQTQTGNPQAGNYSQTVIGNGTYTLTDSGPGATLNSGSGSYGYTEAETASPLAGRFVLTISGTDRYDLLEQFDDVSNSGSGSAPGHMNFSPFGAAFVDPKTLAEMIKELKNKVELIPADEERDRISDNRFEGLYQYFPEVQQLLSELRDSAQKVRSGQFQQLVKNAEGIDTFREKWDLLESFDKTLPADLAKVGGTKLQLLKSGADFRGFSFAVPLKEECLITGCC